jgi:WD40 repeat protein
MLNNTLRIDTHEEAMCQEFQFCADISVSHKPWNLKGIRGGMWCVVQLELERVIGLTTTSPNGLACNTSTGDLAYLAGCVVVVYNVKANCQTHFLTASKTPKAFACVAYSNQGGKFLAAGESGHQPAVIVWEVSTGACVAEMRTHKYGVSCVQFSPNGGF